MRRLPFLPAVLGTVRRLALAGVVAAVLAGCGSDAGGDAFETIDLGYKQDAGVQPSVLFVPPEVERPVSIRVAFSATPPRPLETEISIDCERGPKSAGDEHDQLVRPPHTSTVPATMADADTCSIIVSACPEKPDNKAFDEDPCFTFGGKERKVRGTIRVAVTAKRRP